ncbi:PREDICTED: ribosome biogenesis protein WDR12 homolog [Nicrophorus vespilloides]|uniref:Ribosome biogenesis protein WDR12 homolog n=1 Tax=Nicrophorus vespilloides TaxID=110193 RepID=A0ABM1MD29_NICVS|nr:PREDICTED: ribosome biogenesis protein WDR12 homolog [Nicrophorus vespilloides]
MNTENLSESQLQVKFITKQEIYAVPDVPFSVPVNINIKSLNKLLNELLKENNSNIIKSIDFDFIVLGELLRVSLVEHLEERNQSTEATIEIEYVERTQAPEPQDALLHDDWVSSIQVADKWILTGCYDNTINIWSIKGKHQAASNKHTNCVRSVSWLKKGDPTKGFVSVSHDLTAILWNWEVGTNDIQEHAILKGHERGIDTVSVSPDGTRLATGGWDTHLKIWNASLETDNDEPPSKKTKGTFVRTPLVTVKGHKETISGSMWSDDKTICTSSMDHTIKFWDAEMSSIKSEIVGQKAFLSLSWSPLNNMVLASSADRHIRLYDPRSIEGSICKSTYTSHTLWVPTVTWSQYSEHLFMSGSYDKNVKLWDTRSPKAPLFDLSGHDGKVLCVDWSNNQYLVSGGTDNNVNIFKNNNYN